MAVADARDAVLEPFLRLWALEFVARPPAPGGRTPYPGSGDVAFVRRGGEDLVLKLAPAGTDEARSGEVLAHWDGRGAVRLLAQTAGAILIERARPGDDLSGLVRSGRDDEATLILCQVMAQLNRPAPAAGGFRTVADWGEGFGRNRAAGVSAGIDAAFIDRAEALFFRLCETQGPPILLHGDLQHYNIVRDTDRGWLAIDPKGVLGEPAYETGALLRNPIADPALCADAAIIERRARLISHRLGYDLDRVLGWCFAQWLLGVLWAIEDGLTFAPDWMAGPNAAAEALDRKA